MKVTTNTKQLGSHAHLTVWVNGQNVGKMVADRAQAAQLADRLMGSRAVHRERQLLEALLGEAAVNATMPEAALDLALAEIAHLQRCTSALRELGQGPR